MIRSFSGLRLGLLVGGLVVAVAGGCGGDDDNDSPTARGGGGSGGSGGTTGKGGKASGGNSGSGDAGEANAGDTGVAGDTANGGGGGDGPIVTGEIDDVIAAICDWEFRCCDSGERVYRLGPDGGSVDECVDFFSFQLHDSNQTGNPFPVGSSAAGLLGTIGYTLNLDRVIPNPTGIGQCVAAWEAMDCNTDETAPAFCSETVIPGAGPCALSNMFDPALVVGDECTVALAEGDGNDVECETGSTCLAAGHPDNPSDDPSCVQRSVTGQPCTADEDCDWNFYCDPNNECQPKGDAGEDCTFNDPDAPVPGDEDAGCKAGLKCHPEDLVCIENCAGDFPCTLDSECPDGQSCAPLIVGNDTTSWHACRALGTTAVECDNSADCAPDRRCENGDCLADVTIGTGCTSDADCEVGSFCDRAIFDANGNGRAPTNECTAYFLVNEPCFPGSLSLGFNSGCDPTTARQCILVGPYPGGTWQCKTTKLAAASQCFPYSFTVAPLEPTDCAQGLECEYASGSATDFSCTAGAEEGENCDANLMSGTYQLCGTGLFCDPDTAECIAKQDPGGDCEDGNGLPDDGLCKNADCVAHWSGDGRFVCSDAPIPDAQGGDNLTCGP